MRDAIAHRVQSLPRYVGVLRGKYGICTLKFVGSLTYDLEVAQHGVLHEFTAQEGRLIQTGRVALDTLDGLENVTEVVQDAQRLGYIGTASAMT
ncbi:hypothetical protein Tchar_00136 [Tepidimonas charontis]|uniref:Uncharacterized protein n=1 Tax=Tepidimonas charontis TaxID=2267262 RepID=A0A554XL01_9BURK|nr:hypothetical protein Tchar_00136 [Tepidimonas charontis]